MSNAELVSSIALGCEGCPSGFVCDLNGVSALAASVGIDFHGIPVNIHQRLEDKGVMVTQEYSIGDPCGEKSVCRNKEAIRNLGGVISNSFMRMPNQDTIRVTRI